MATGTPMSRAEMNQIAETAAVIPSDIERMLPLTVIRVRPAAMMPTRAPEKSTARTLVEEKKPAVVNAATAKRTASKVITTAIAEG